MKLTGKCKKDFNKWAINQPFFDISFNALCIDISNHYTEWRRFPESMQYGVLVDFFDSVGIYVNTMKFDDKHIGLAEYLLDKHCKTRQESRIKSIEKANEIYNKK